MRTALIILLIGSGALFAVPPPQAPPLYRQLMQAPPIPVEELTSVDDENCGMGYEHCKCCRCVKCDCEMVEATTDRSERKPSPCSLQCTCGCNEVGNNWRECDCSTRTPRQSVPVRPMSMGNHMNHDMNHGHGMGHGMHSGGQGMGHGHGMHNSHRRGIFPILRRPIFRAAPRRSFGGRACAT